jgi:hypothetical protein
LAADVSDLRSDIAIAGPRFCGSVFLSSLVGKWLAPEWGLHEKE